MLTSLTQLQEIAARQVAAYSAPGAGPVPRYSLRRTELVPVGGILMETAVGSLALSPDLAAALYAVVPTARSGAAKGARTLSGYARLLAAVARG